MKTDLTAEEQKECLDALGKEYLVSAYGYDTYEDFWTYSKRGAELLAKGLRKLLKASHGPLASVDVVEDTSTRGFPSRYKSPSSNKPSDELVRLQRNPIFLG